MGADMEGTRVLDPGPETPALGMTPVGYMDLHWMGVVTYKQRDEGSEVTGKVEAHRRGSVDTCAWARSRGARQTQLLECARGAQRPPCCARTGRLPLNHRRVVLLCTSQARHVEGKGQHKRTG